MPVVLISEKYVKISLCVEVDVSEHSRYQSPARLNFDPVIMLVFVWILFYFLQSDNVDDGPEDEVRPKPILTNYKQEVER